MSGVENIRFGGGRIEFTVNDKSSRYHGKHLELDVESGYAYEFGHVGEDSQRVRYFAPDESLDTFGPNWRQKATGETENAAQAKKDVVDKPAHYSRYGMESIDAMRGTMSPEEFNGFLKGNAFKYLTRAGAKDALEQDLHKVCWYTMFLYLANGGTVEALGKTYEYMKERFAK